MGIFHFGLDTKIHGDLIVDYRGLKIPKSNSQSLRWESAIFEAEKSPKSPSKILKISSIPAMGIWDLRGQKSRFIPGIFANVIWDFLSRDFLGMGIFRGWVFFERWGIPPKSHLCSVRGRRVLRRLRINIQTLKLIYNIKINIQIFRK